MNTVLKIFISLVLVILPQASNAQTAENLSLILSGKREVDVRIIDRDDDIYFRYSLRMTFENKAQYPVIIINPTLGFGTGLKEARFFFRSTANPKKLELESLLKVYEQDRIKIENFRAMAQYFEGDRPPDNMTMILKPGETLSFNENIFVELSFLAGCLSDTGLEFAKLRKKDPVSRQHALSYFSNRGVDFDSLQLTYEFSFLPYVTDPELLEKMSHRWSAFGRLPVGTNGTYTITSEKIKY